MRYIHSTALIVLALAGCAAPPPAPEVRPAPVAPALRPVSAPPPLAADWNDWPFTPGDWQYSQQSGSSTASFAIGRLTFYCHRESRQVTVGGIGNAPATIRTTTMTRSIMPTALDRVPSQGIVRLAANDPLLDAIAFSRGRFVIEQSGQPPLVLPPQAEIGRVIEDCRG